MKFNIYEYKEHNFNLENGKNIIIENDYIFIHEEKYSEKFPNKFIDQEGKEANTDYPAQLKNQIFILINKNTKKIYSYEASLEQTKDLIKNFLGVPLEIFLRFKNGIEGFIKKLKNLKMIKIKGDGSPKLSFVKEFMDKQEDLSKCESFELKLNYKQGNWFSKDKYNEILKYDISDLKIEGESEESIIVFNKKEILEHITIDIEKNEDNNIYEKTEVFKKLKNHLKK